MRHETQYSAMYSSDRFRTLVGRRRRLPRERKRGHSRGITLLSGGITPFILHRISSEECYSLVGEAYVIGSREASYSVEKWHSMRPWYYINHFHLQLSDQRYFLISLLNSPGSTFNPSKNYDTSPLWQSSGCTHTSRFLLIGTFTAPFTQLNWLCGLLNW